MSVNFSFNARWSALAPHPPRHPDHGELALRAPPWRSSTARCDPFLAKSTTTRFLTSVASMACGWDAGQRAALLAMGLHELATNAAKYGALSNGYGVVSLGWEVTGEEDTQSVRLTWRELGGPLVLPPERKGFGSFLIERALQGSGGGGAKLDFNPNGLICSLEVAL